MLLPKARSSTCAALLSLRRSTNTCCNHCQTVGSIPNVLALAPGLFNPTAVAGLVVAFGGTIGSNGLYVDGVDMTTPRTQSAWLPINYNWVDQMQIAALGAGAKYGEFTGAIGNAVLRSGGNRFSALAELWTTDWQWIDRNGSSLAGREILTWWDSSAQAGGPIRPDRLWFFGGVKHLWQRCCPALAAERPARSLGSLLTIVKLTHALSTDTRVEGHVTAELVGYDWGKCRPVRCTGCSERDRTIGYELEHPPDKAASIPPRSWK